MEHRLSPTLALALKVSELIGSGAITDPSAGIIALQVVCDFLPTQFADAAAILGLAREMVESKTALIIGDAIVSIADADFDGAMLDLLTAVDLCKAEGAKVAVRLCENVIAGVVPSEKAYRTSLPWEIAADA